MIQPNCRLHDGRNLTPDSSNHSSNNDENFLYQVGSLVIYTTIGLAIIWIFPFPADFVILALILIFVNLCKKKAIFGRISRPNENHVKGWRGLFESIFQPLGSSSTYGSRVRGDGLIRYYCMSCGMENNGIACSRCGSKMKKAD